MNYDFSKLTHRQQELLTFNGWQPGFILYAQPTARTVEKLIRRGLLVEYTERTGQLMVKCYRVPTDVHMAWCAHCAARVPA